MRLVHLEQVDDLVLRLAFAQQKFWGLPVRLLVLVLKYGQQAELKHRQAFEVLVQVVAAALLVPLFAQRLGLPVLMPSQSLPLPESEALHVHPTLPSVDEFESRPREQLQHLESQVLLLLVPLLQMVVQSQVPVAL